MPCGDETSATTTRGWFPYRGGGIPRILYACQQADVHLVERILQTQQGRRRRILDQRDRSGRSALHYCSTSPFRVRSTHVAHLLTMAAPELIDGRDEDGFTPLHLAVIAGNMPLVTFLLASNADVFAVDAEKHSVVHWATVCGETEALRAVLAAGAPISTPDVHGGYPLHYAAQMCATMQDKDNELGLVVLQTLLAHSGIDVGVRDGDGRPPLLWAASAGSAKAMLALIRAGGGVEVSDKDGLTALHCAASRGHTECIDTLLTLCGSSVDVIDSNGCTALHYAVTLGHADATALLLAHGANANRQDRKGRTAAHCGCAKGQIETVKMLAMHEANLWLRNARGDLPLHEAAGSGRRDLVKWLLDSKPTYVNARNNDGRCPLHLAAINDNPDMCKILIDHGAAINPVLRTSKNVFMTPLDCALQRGFRSTAKYLQLQGGLPASKLGTSTIHVNIRENITVDVSHSSDEESTHLDAEVRKSRKKAGRGKRHTTKKDVATVKTEVTVSERNHVSVHHQEAQETIDHETVRKRGKLQRSSPDVRKKTMQTQTSLMEVSPSRIDENIKEINTLAQSIEAKAKSICEEVNHIETNLDQKSFTSLENTQQQIKQIVVEAAVHSPPEQSTSDRIQYQEVVKSLKEELEAMKEEIRNLKKIEVSTGKDSIQELQTMLEGRVKEIRETVEDFKSDIKSAIAAGSKGVPVGGDQDLTKIDPEVIRGLERKVMELEKQREVDIHETTELGIVEDSFLNEVATNLPHEVEEVLIPQEDDKESEMKETMREDLEKEEETRVDIEPEQVATEILTGEANPDDIPEDHIQGEEREVADKAFQVIESTEMENQLSIDDTAPNTDADTETKAFEVLQPPQLLETVTEKTVDEVVFELITEPEQREPVEEPSAPESDDSNRRRFLKSEKQRDQHLESSLDDVNSESSFSSTATKREHKSFTVIQPQTQSIGKSSAVAKKKKLRSRSEETRKNQENLLRRQRLPTTSVQGRRAKSNLEARVPHLPDLDSKYKTRSETNIAGMEVFSEDEEDVFGEQRRRVKRRPKQRSSKSAESDYESSNLIDSGFEPSPRSTRIPKWRNVSDRGVNMTSVTQTIQTNIRRYHLERKIFQHLLELKRLQIRAGQHNEAMLVKRAIDAYHRSCAATVGGGRYVPKDFTFRSFEMFLYESLRKIQKSAAPEYLRGLPEGAVDNPLLCTQSTNRCLHTTHAYTGIPCAAYLPKMDHHTIPKIGFNSSTACRPQGFLPDINKKAVTLELCHGNDKQVISLPTDRLDQNKRYYVTFTVKGESEDSEQPKTNTPNHQHSKSM